MMRWGSLRQEPARPAIESPPAPKSGGAVFTCAFHLRGRIDRRGSLTASGHRRYIWQVVNTRTGRVVIESDAVGWTNAVADASEATFIARGAHFWSLKREGLR